MDRNRRRVLAAAALAPLLPLTGCASRPLTRVGSVVWIGYEPLFLARDLGLYDPARLRLVEMPSSTTNLMLLATGDVEAAALTLDECLLAREGGVDLRVILVFDYSAGADVLMARPGIERLQDLRGQRIGVEETAASALMLAKILERAALAPADVRKVMLASGQQVESYRANQVDAVVSWEPFATQLEAEGARRLFDSRAIPGLIVDVLAARAEALASAPENFRDLLAGYFKALHHLRTVPDDALRRMTLRLGLDERAIRASLRGIEALDLAANHEWLDGGSSRLARAVDMLSQTLQAHGLLQRKPDLRGLSDSRFLPKDA